MIFIVLLACYVDIQADVCGCDSAFVFVVHYLQKLYFGWPKRYFFDAIRGLCFA